MDELLKKYRGQVVTHGQLCGVLSSYRSPSFKIHKWMKEGELIGLRKGMYVVPYGPGEGVISLPLVANHLYGPSYVSLEYALYQHGLLTERPRAVSSVTILRGRDVETPLGLFTYQRLPEAYYAVGMTRVMGSTKVAYLMARPEKALCDWLGLTPNLRLYSVGGVAQLLLEDMRMDEETVIGLDGERIAHYATLGFRTQRLALLAAWLEGMR